MTETTSNCPAGCTYLRDHFHKAGWTRDHQGWWHKDDGTRTCPPVETVKALAHAEDQPARPKRLSDLPIFGWAWSGDAEEVER